MVDAAKVTHLYCFAKICTTIFAGFAKLPRKNFRNIINVG
jgi:hypothetical protein